MQGEHVENLYFSDWYRIELERGALLCVSNKQLRAFLFSFYRAACL